MANILEVVGELFGSNPDAWSLTNLDNQQFGPPSVTFEGQFIAENMTENIGSQLGENVAINKATPDFQWLHGEAETFTFTTRLFASNTFANIQQQIQTLKSLTRRDPDLRRAPRFSFQAGTEITFTCFIKGIRFLYDELRSNGTIHGAVINITLQKIEDLAPKDTTPDLVAILKTAAGVIGTSVGIVRVFENLGNFPGLSIHTVSRKVEARHGDTFESLAVRYYGNANQGDILRRAHPEIRDVSAGDRISIIEPNEAKNIEVTQQSVALKNTQRNEDVKLDAFDRQNTTKTVFI